jgi:putative copper export protein
MLASGLDTLRLTLHVLSASIWVGGQFVLAGLVGPSRSLSPEAPRALARAFGRLAWPAYAVLVVTGFWNVSTFHWASQSFAWKAVLIVKIVVVAAAGLGAFFHGRATARTAIAVWGSVAGLASVAALVLGVLLAG